MVGQVDGKFWERRIVIYLYQNAGSDDLPSTSRDGPQLQIAPGVRLALLPVDRPRPGSTFPKCIPLQPMAPNRKASMAVPTPPSPTLPQQITFFPPPGPAFALAHMGECYWGIVVSSRNFGKPAFCQVNLRDQVGGPGGGTLGALARPYLTPSQTDRELHRPRKCHPFLAKLFL